MRPTVPRNPLIFRLSLRLSFESPCDGEVKNGQKDYFGYWIDGLAGRQVVRGPRRARRERCRSRATQDGDRRPEGVRDGGPLDGRWARVLIPTGLRNRLLRPPRGSRRLGRARCSSNCTIRRSGDVYEGAFRNGMRHGAGVYTYKRRPGKQRQRVYEGEWRRSKRHGEGKETWEDGTVYEGAFADDAFHGLGTYRTPFAKYRGNFEAGYKSGQGSVVYYKSKDTYDGEWRRNRFHGVGTYYWGNNTKYEGQWEDGARTGFGVFLEPSGEKHEGHWKSNEKHGAGTTRSAISPGSNPSASRAPLGVARSAPRSNRSFWICRSTSRTAASSVSHARFPTYATGYPGVLPTASRLCPPPALPFGFGLVQGRTCSVLPWNSDPSSASTARLAALPEFRSRNAIPRNLAAPRQSSPFRPRGNSSPSPSPGT